MAVPLRLINSIAVFSLMLLAGSPAFSQLGEGENAFGALPDGFGQFGDFDTPSDEGESLQLESFIVPADGDEPALLVIRAKMATGWHVYSLTQKEGGPPPTKITIHESDAFEFLDGFRAKEKPKKRMLFETWPEVEEHYGQVNWIAPIRFQGGMVPVGFEIKGELTEGQVCNDEISCIPFDQLDTKFTATLANKDQIASIRPPAPAASGEYVDAENNVVIRGHIEPKVVAPGEMAKLILTIEPQEGWHVYIQEDEVDPLAAYRPTLMPLVNTSGLQPKRPVANTEVVEKEDVRYQDGATTWTIDLAIPASAEPGEYKVDGHLGYQTCTDRTCKMPSGVQFRGAVHVGAQAVDGMAPLGFDKGSYADAKEALSTSIAWASKSTTDPKVDEANASINYAKLPLMIGFSLLGGLILNLMPCVLPVIGLKILSFAEQAGQHRARVFGLNLAYSIGLMSVFIALATLAVFLNLGWGEQFTSTWFNVAMCGLVFAMALSFLGVWEIPIPGFVGGEAANKLESQEGMMGAFSKGILTTLLATPCSGPFLGPVFGFTLNQPWVVTYIIFGAIGLGMALPYLIIGAFPALVRFIPKPGAWMSTFKQLMGFVLLGTVVFLFSFMDKDYVVATFALLVGIWLACWWIGRTPLTASSGKRTTAWIGGGITAALIGLFAFSMLVPKESKIPWQPYSPAALAKAQAEGKTVMVDYTADWCLTCKTNLKFAINTDQVYEKIDENAVVPLLADWTKPSDDIKASLKRLNSKSIPILAIYPANRPGEVIVLRDLITQAQLLEALEKAGPSAKTDDDEAAARTAMKPSP